MRVSGLRALKPTAGMVPIIPQPSPDISHASSPGSQPSSTTSISQHAPSQPGPTVQKPAAAAKQTPASRQQAGLDVSTADAAEQPLRQPALPSPAAEQHANAQQNDGARVEPTNDPKQASEQVPEGTVAVGGTRPPGSDSSRSSSSAGSPASESHHQSGDHGDEAGLPIHDAHVMGGDSRDKPQQIPAGAEAASAPATAASPPEHGACPAHPEAAGHCAGHAVGDTGNVEPQANLQAEGHVEQETVGHTFGELASAMRRPMPDRAPESAHAQSLVGHSQAIQSKQVCRGHASMECPVSSCWVKSIESINRQFFHNFMVKFLGKAG